MHLQVLQALYGPLGSPIPMTEYSTLAGNIVAAYKAALDSLYAAGARKIILTVQSADCSLPACCVLQGHTHTSYSPAE